MKGDKCDKSMQSGDSVQSNLSAINKRKRGFVRRHTVNSRTRMFENEKGKLHNIAKLFILHYYSKNTYLKRSLFVRLMSIFHSFTF